MTVTHITIFVLIDWYITYLRENMYCYLIFIVCILYQNEYACKERAQCSLNKIQLFSWSYATMLVAFFISGKCPRFWMEATQLCEATFYRRHED